MKINVNSIAAVLITMLFLVLITWLIVSISNQNDTFEKSCKDHNGFVIKGAIKNYCVDSKVIFDVTK